MSNPNTKMSSEALRVRAKKTSQLEVIEHEKNSVLIREYADELFGYAHELVASTKPDPLMIDQQPEIQWYMRTCLLDFLLETHLSFHLHSPTLYLAVSILDRYCSKRVVYKKHYQLVGCTALWIAAKYEDKKSRVPTLKELKAICGDVYDEEMFVQMEGHILSSLDWLIGSPTIDTFVSEILTTYPTEFAYLNNQSGSHALSVSVSSSLIKYLCELSMYFREFLFFTPSIVGHAALILSNEISAFMHSLQFNPAGIEIPLGALLTKEIDQQLVSLGLKTPKQEKNSDAEDEQTTDKLVNKCLQRFLLVLGEPSKMLSQKYARDSVSSMAQRYFKALRSFIDDMKTRTVHAHRMNAINSHMKNNVAPGISKVGNGLGELANGSDDSLDSLRTVLTTMPPRSCVFPPSPASANNSPVVGEFASNSRVSLNARSGHYYYHTSQFPNAAGASRVTRPDAVSAETQTYISPPCTPDVMFMQQQGSSQESQQSLSGSNALGQNSRPQNSYFLGSDQNQSSQTGNENWYRDGAVAMDMERPMNMMGHYGYQEININM